MMPPNAMNVVALAVLLVRIKAGFHQKVLINVNVCESPVIRTFLRVISQSTVATNVPS